MNPSKKEQHEDERKSDTMSDKHDDGCGCDWSEDERSVADEVKPYNSGSDPDAVCGFQVYDIDAYQSAAVATMSKEPDDLKTRLAICALGLTGEAGEVADHVKKHLGHGHDLDVEKIIKEIGDVIWYAAVMAHVLGVKLSEVTAKNVAKLKARYPKGFSVEASKNRKLGDE